MLSILVALSLATQLCNVVWCADLMKSCHLFLDFIERFGNAEHLSVEE